MGTASPPGQNETQALQVSAALERAKRCWIPRNFWKREGKRHSKGKLQRKLVRRKTQSKKMKGNLLEEYLLDSQNPKTWQPC